MCSPALQVFRQCLVPRMFPSRLDPHRSRHSLKPDSVWPPVQRQEMLSIFPAIARKHARL